MVTFMLLRAKLDKVTYRQLRQATVVYRDLDQASLCVTDPCYRSLIDTQALNKRVASAFNTCIQSPVINHSWTSISATHYFPSFLYSSWAYESSCDSGIRLGEVYSPSPLVADWDQGVRPRTKPQFSKGTGELRRLFLLRGSGRRYREIAGLYKPATLVSRDRVRSLKRVSTDQKQEHSYVLYSPFKRGRGWVCNSCPPLGQWRSFTTPTTSYLMPK